ncbi:hypothetical protein AB0I27_23050 [Streptomyces sp. NPDC050597]|uniref:hypothetical protein n=1 Tax=Streptomyces sp. NPDC050597 TaxID=3157212 RepID=UPI0034166217
MPAYSQKTADAIAESGIPMSADSAPPSPERLTPEQRASLAELIGAAKPATAKLLNAFGEAVRDCREHEHPKGEDFHCLNLAAWMGERAALVLRRLLDAEASVERLERQAEFWETAARKNGELYAAAENQRDEARESLSFLERNTLPELRRTIQHHEDGKKRWRDRAEKAEPERDALQERLHQIALAKVWTNEDRKKFVFVEDIARPLFGLDAEAGDAS